MFLQRLLRPGPAKAAAQRLYAATVAEARSAALYAELGNSQQYAAHRKAG